jgi:hypothetical protein
MRNNYESTILNKLLDKYEKSKQFTEDNKVNRRITLKVSSEFPKYDDHSDYNTFTSVNDAIANLERLKLVTSRIDSSGVCESVFLDPDSVYEAYEHIRRVPKRATNNSLQEVLSAYADSDDEILNNYCKDQLERLRLNKALQHANDKDELSDVLRALEEIKKLQHEKRIRDFSMMVFKDSKRFESIASKVISILYAYGDFPEKEHILGDLNLIKNETYVYFKGPGTIKIGEQIIDFGVITGSIGLSSSILQHINDIKINCDALITIENRTSFDSFDEGGFFAIYLGGYHNEVRRDFIKKIYERNPSKKYFHFGDIDAGGFYILEHLRKKTLIDFVPYKMDVQTLLKYKKYAKKITENDRNRLERLLGLEFDEVIQLMLREGLKLEQEAINVKLD